MRAVEVADLIASLLADEWKDGAVGDVREAGPLFARVRLSGPEGVFALTVESLPRRRSPEGGDDA